MKTTRLPPIVNDQRDVHYGRGMDLAPTTIIIADDFTGACDTGVQLARPDDPCPVVLWRAEEASRQATLAAVLAESGRAVIDTESRHADPETAGRMVAAAAAAAATAGATAGPAVDARVARPAAATAAAAVDAKVGRPVETPPGRTGRGLVVYKKVDSTLRGNIRSELAALRQVFPDRFVLVAPAFPAAGRTTRDGVCLVHGTPVHRTEFARDRLSPVRSSRIADLVEAGGPIVVVVPRELDSLLGTVREDETVIVDAADQADLEEAARALRGAGVLDRAILVGSAGLARALGNNLVPRPRASSGPDSAGHSPVNAERPRGGLRPVLGLVGSLSEASRRQLTRLASAGVHVETVGGFGDSEVRDRVVKRVSEGASVVVATPAEATGQGSRAYAAALGAIAAAAVQAAEGLGVFATGGDTAVAAIEAIGGNRIRVLAELTDGIPLLTLTAPGPGTAVEVPMVTKAGGFGGEDVMIEAFEALSRT